MSLSESRADWIVRETRKRQPADRSTFLDGACAGDEALRKRLEAILAEPHGFASSITEQTELAPLGPSNDFHSRSDEAVGQTIGRYKVLQKIGEGGCGAVYMAEQEQPVRRRVALKVIKLGMDTKAVIARFEAERQALALMDHPNIARVLDAGTTETGRPYFVMELVRGIKFTEYCDQNHLGVDKRLELFTQICQAIQHAHQKGIIHRDIKPSNILVTLHDGVPVPKVIDFGIAKATTDQRLTDKTLFTAYEQFIGTPAYMSPEQAEMSGLDIDTRSDIYSLGVLLYELLTGRTPFDPKELMDSGLDAMRKTIREKDPMRPSTKLHTLMGEELTTTARRHGVEGPKLVSQLRGDLDWIVMKCLEKDRTRRYETANGLAMDIKRHVSNQPVTARPPSKLYEFQKTFRRHKVGFIATGSVILALAIGVALTTWQAMLATHAKGQEAIQRRKAQDNEQLAMESSAKEASLRRKAEAQELAARQRAYASDMNIAALALQGNNWGRAVDLLNRQRPGKGQKDLRGWEWRYLWQQVRSDALFSLCRESSEINSLSVSPNGSLLAVSTRHRGGVSVWDLGARREVIRLAEGGSYARVAFSPTEPLLALSSLAPGSAFPQTKDTLRLWNAATRQIVQEFPLEGSCLGMAFANDGRTLATSTMFRSGAGRSSSGGSITLWRVPEGTKLFSFPTTPSGTDPGILFACTADLSVAAYSEDRGRIHVVDLHNGKELWTAVASKEYVTTLAFSPDGQTLASGSGFAESDIRLWRVATGEPTGQLAGHNSWVSSIVFWPDGKRLATSSADQTIRIWDIAKKECVDVLRGHRQEVWRLALLPDNKTLISGSKDGVVCFWDTALSHVHQSHITLPERVVTWAMTHGSQSIVALNQEGQVSRWTGPDFQHNTRLVKAGRAYVERNGELFSEDGRTLAVGSTNGTIQVWDLERCDLKRQWTEGVGEVRPGAFVEGGSKLVTTTMVDGLHHEREVSSGQQIQSWRWPADFIGLSVSPDDRYCLAYGYGGNYVLRTLPDKSDRMLPLDCVEGAAASFSTDGSLFVIASDMGYARVWNTSTWREVTTLGGVLLGMNSGQFSTDGKRLVIASSGVEAAKLFDTESWQEVFTLAGLGYGAMGAKFSPDGNSVLWGNITGDLYIWRAPSWDEIRAAEARENSEAPGNSKGM
jgi:eukaryotic-like serine/threonine-protein kinase